MEWETYRKKYADRIMEIAGFDEKNALECADAGKWFYDEQIEDGEDEIDPVADADAEMECWDSDGGEEDE